MSLEAAITHLTGAVHDAGAGVVIVTLSPGTTLVEKAQKASGHGNAIWQVQKQPVDDGEVGLSTTRWALTMVLRVLWLFGTDQQTARMQAAAAISKVANALRTAVLDAAAATAGIVTVNPGTPKRETARIQGGDIIAIPVEMKLRGDL